MKALLIKRSYNQINAFMVLKLPPKKNATNHQKETEVCNQVSWFLICKPDNNNANGVKQ